MPAANDEPRSPTVDRSVRREEFCGFPRPIDLCPPNQEIHIILDNLSAHKTHTVADFLEAHPQVRLHFTPSYSSWVNHVELWFAKIERGVISRGVSTSVKDLSAN
jgi:transposase